MRRNDGICAHIEESRLHMNLSERQEKIISVVKEFQPVSGEKISEQLAISRATLRADLSFLTMVGILQASPKVGYTYVGETIEPLFFDKTFSTKISEIMIPPLLITHDSSIHDAITTLFMYDVGSLYVTNQEQELVGVLSRKDLLRASLSNHIEKTPVAVVMTRAPHIKTCTKDMSILEAGDLLGTYQVDSLPIVSETQPLKVIGKVTKSRLLDYIIQQAKSTEMNR